jgi:hypothetical protein
MLTRADDLPKNTNPRAIFGDSVEPDWDQRLTITVGSEKADLVGTTDRAIQAAVDYLARRGGGTVRVLPGTYRLRNSIFLQSKVRMLGSGTDSVLFKEPSVTSKLVVDGDHWDQEVTLADPQGFQVGDGVRLVSKDPYGKGTNIVQRTLFGQSLQARSPPGGAFPPRGRPPDRHQFLAAPMHERRRSPDRGHRRGWQQGQE